MRIKGVLAVLMAAVLAGCAEEAPPRPPLEARGAESILVARDAACFAALLDKRDYDLNTLNAGSESGAFRGMAALHLAILTDGTPNGPLPRERMVRELLRLGADVNLPCTYENAGMRIEGATPLMCALLFSDALRLDAHEESVRICHRLLDAGAKPGVTAVRTVNGNRETHSALSLAVLYGNTDICKLLLEHGADPDQTLDGEVTARSLAEKIGNAYLLRVLTGKKSE